jgi:two-component system response regulator HydG
MMAERETIDVSDLPEYIRARQPFDMAEGGIEPLEQVEKTYTLRVLESVNGNKAKAAELLGISRAKLYRILADMELAEETPDASLAPD